ncbi:MAG: CPBP family intramembrane metalloprotease [Defluviitaleaceae bacterium]|nr:CPBP family intramembrane metalloprotease [Defluviitaleaceae bacterium]
MQKLINKLASYNTFIFVMVTLGISFLFLAFCRSVIVPWYENLFGPIIGPNHYLDGVPFYVVFIMVALIAPLVETLVNQFLVIYLLLRFTRFPLWIVICISALFFGIAHTYSVYYVFYTFVIGIIFAVAFVACKQKRGYFYAFWVVALIHGLFNAIITLGAELLCSAIPLAWICNPCKHIKFCFRIFPYLCIINFVIFRINAN